ncbi:hypothetical protein DITRI_Ditri09bG0124300 [Diplodiscus trichospermus]
MSFVPPEMNERLRSAAKEGKIDELYRLIQEDGNVLKSFDEKEFIETPLHIAAAEDRIAFAMEMMSLKPSFARKLNPQGLTPLHLAVEKGHKKLVLLLLQKAKDLFRIQGKNGETPVHYVITRERNSGVQLLSKFLEDCPESIRDVTVENQTALHIAVKNNKEAALKILCKMLKKTNYCEDVVNQKDVNGNTALHLAAHDNRHQMIKLLLKCKADMHATNQDNKTAHDVAETHNNRESIGTLRCCLIPTVSAFTYNLNKQFVKYVTRASTIIFHDIDNISSADRNGLLVILGLLLTATFQASLNPPRGVRQRGSSSSSIDYEGDDSNDPGKSVMSQFDFLLFYIPTSSVFVVTFFLTLGLLKPFPRGFKTALQILLAFLAICFYESIFFIAPTDLAGLVINGFSFLIFVLMMLMCIAYRVSKVSVLILGCWLLPMGPYRFTVSIGNFLIGCFLFLVLYDEFWKGSAVVMGFSIFTGLVNNDLFIEPSIILGCWFFFSLCRFCIKQCNERCSCEQSNTVPCQCPCLLLMV